MNIIKNSITQTEYTSLVNKIDNIGSSNSMTLAQCDKYKFVVGATDNDFIYIDLVDKSTGSMINNVLIKPDGTLGGRGVDNRSVCLFHNAGGSNGTITLSQNASNFTYLEIFFKYVHEPLCNSVRVFGAEGKTAMLSIIRGYQGNMIWYSRSAVISGNTITQNSSVTYGNAYGSVITDGNLYIYRVVGHVA